MSYFAGLVLAQMSEHVWSDGAGLTLDTGVDGQTYVLTHHKEGSHRTLTHFLALYGGVDRKTTPMSWTLPLTAFPEINTLLGNWHLIDKSEYKRTPYVYPLGDETRQKGVANVYQMHYHLLSVLLLAITLPTDVKGIDEYHKLTELHLETGRGLYDLLNSDYTKVDKYNATRRALLAHPTFLTLLERYLRMHVDLQYGDVILVVEHFIVRQLNRTMYKPFPVMGRQFYVDKKGHLLIVGMDATYALSIEPPAEFTSPIPFPLDFYRRLTTFNTFERSWIGVNLDLKDTEIEYEAVVPTAKLTELHEEIKYASCQLRCTRGDLVYHIIILDPHKTGILSYEDAVQAYSSPGVKFRFNDATNVVVVVPQRESRAPL